MAQCTAKEPENHTRCLLLQLAKVYLLLIGLSDFPQGKMCLNVSPYLKNKTSWLVWFSKTEHTKQPSSSQGDSGSKECHLDHMQRVYIYKHSYYFFSCMEKNW